MGDESRQPMEELLVSYTLFPNVWPTEKVDRCDVPWAELTEKIRNAPTYIDKAHCPLVSLCEYGVTLSASTKQPILRHAANVLRAYGAELDYDGEKIAIDEAARTLRDAGVASILYTSPSHTDSKPRWRALLPFSEPMLPEKRAEYLARANRLLGGIASRESFALSQSFYIGRVRGSPYEVRETSGRTIDLAADIEPLYWASRLNGSASPRDETTDSELRAAFDRGEDRYNAMLKLSSRWAARGMPADDIEANLLEMLGAGSLNADGVDLKTRCRPMAQSAVRKYGESRRPPDRDTEDEATAMPERPAAMDWQALQGLDPPPREWIMSDWIPAGHVTLLAGRGGIGKTLLAQHIGTAVALGAAYISQTAKKRVLMWAGEDDERELWRRQLAICRHFGVNFADIAVNFRVLSYSGRDVTLADVKYGALGQTLMMADLRAQREEFGAELVIIDNIARVYGGSENERHSVTAFLAWLQGACAPAAVLLLGHPSKQLGSEFSGSTAWEGAVRSRLYLSDRPPDEPVDDDAPPANDSTRYLSRRKANYSALDLRQLRLEEGGALAPVDAVRAVRGFHPDSEFSQDEVRRAAATLAQRDLYGTASTASSNYLPTLAKQFGLLGNLTAPQFTATMRKMVMSGKLVREKVGSYDNRTSRFGLVAKP